MHKSSILKGDSIIAKPKRSQKQLEAELADAKLLHRLSIELIQEDGTAGLYKKIVEAAVAIMRSQYASMQMLYPDQGCIGKLRLLASSGFSPDAEKFWEWVYRQTGSSCGAALRAEKRVVIPNFTTCDFMQDAPTLPIFLSAGIYAAQSTPLYSRSGKLLGMISTHWNFPHNPPERHLHLLDILARQAADLIERTQTAEALKQSEERLRALTMELEKRVEERTKELQRSNEDLQQFAHVASHDLKEPVRKIKVFADMVNNQYGNLLPDAGKEFLHKIHNSANRMKSMIEGVLTYSSLNNIDQFVEPINLQETIADVQQELELLIREKNARITLGHLHEVEGVSVLLYQLLYNLINNALKFSRTNIQPHITISSSQFVEAGMDLLRIEIKDNGIGFDDSEIKRIFNPFTRLNSKEEYEGSGLGLSLCKKIVDRHHGKIYAISQLGIGSTFTIELPLKHIESKQIENQVTTNL